MNTNGKGVFSQNDLKGLVLAGRIIPKEGFKEEHIGCASIDVGVTTEIYRVERIIQPNPHNNDTVRSLLPMMGAKQIEPWGVLEVGVSYLAKATIDVNFPEGCYGYFNAKSTSGRNFLFVRTLADRIVMFDSADKRHIGYSGEIWLVIQPLAYPIILDPSECLNQVRVFNADTRFGPSDLSELLLGHNLLYRAKDQKPYEQGRLGHFTYNGTIQCTLDVRPGRIGFKVRESARRPMNLAERNIDPREYFEEVFSAEFEKGNHRSRGIDLESMRYYLLSTKEMIKVPTHVCAELVPIDRRLGDLFTHFAGFFDSGFYGTGTLEVFAPRHVSLRHKQPLAVFMFERMRSETPSYADGKAHYAGQIGTKLPKQFASWD